MILGGIGINFHVDLGIFGIQTCYLACLVASARRPGGPLGDPRTLGSTGKDTLRSRLDFYRFVVHVGTPF